MHKSYLITDGADNFKLSVRRNACARCCAMRISESFIAGEDREGWLAEARLFRVQLLRQNYQFTMDRQYRRWNS
jgi:hypothetical protein